MWSTGSSARETSIFTVYLCFHVPWTFVCLPTWACCPCLCDFLCGLCPTTADRNECYRPWDMEQAEGCTRHPKSVGDWPMHLWGRPVQDRNEERMASDNAEQCVHKLGVYIKRHKEAHSFCCVDVCVCTGNVCGRLEDSSSVNPVVWGF